MSSERKQLITIDRVLNVVVIVAAGSVLLSPNNALSHKLREAYDNHKQAELVRALWDDLISEGARIGPEGGDVIAVEFADYQCPFCKRFHTEYGEVVHASGTVVYRHLPLTTIHPYAESAALGSICSEEQGGFQRLHNFLMENGSWEKSEPDWTAIAAQVGLEPDRFSTCMASQSARERLERDVELAQRLRLTGTPSLVTAEGRIVSGLPSESEGLPW